MPVRSKRRRDTRWESSRENRRAKKPFAKGEKLLVGAIAEVLARLVMPGSGPSGFVVGIFGATGATGLNIWSILVATLGAVIPLFLYGPIARRSA